VDSFEIETITSLMCFLFGSLLRKDMVYRWAREHHPSEGRPREAWARAVRQPRRPIQIHEQPDPAHPRSRRWELKQRDHHFLAWRPPPPPKTHPPPPPPYRPHPMTMPILGPGGKKRQTGKTSIWLLLTLSSSSHAHTHKQPGDV